MERRRSKRGAEPRATVRGSGPFGERSCSAGFSLVESLVVLGLVGVVLATAVPTFSHAADVADAAGAARYLASLVAKARVEAARRQRTVGLRFLRTSPASFVAVVDGDGDGITTSDVTAGIDRPLGFPDRLEDHFRGARFGIGAVVPAIDDTRMLAPGDDPIRFGVADQLSASPIGSATSGTAYVVSRRGVQFAVRVSGITGRSRVLRYDPGGATWLPY
jgi:prepilin-type N-terminal cleavage/methylation domain-containing protein